MNGHVVVFMTIQSADEAARIGKTVVEERLAACCNIVPGIRSIYTWKGKVHDEPEVLCVLKTKAVLFDELKARLRQLHTYEVPEIIAVDIKAGLPEYLNWIDSSTK